MKLRELRGLAELLAFSAGRTVRTITDYCYDALPLSFSEGRVAKAEFTDDSVLYVVTDYDAGYSEYTPGNGATVNYYVVDERKVTS